MVIMCVKQLTNWPPLMQPSIYMVNIIKVYSFLASMREFSFYNLQFIISCFLLKETLVAVTPWRAIRQ